MVKVCDIENIKYYRKKHYFSIIQRKWKNYINNRNKSANIIIQYWKIFKKKKLLWDLFFIVIIQKKINYYAKKIQYLWKNKNMKIKIKNFDCPISLIPLKDIEWTKKILLENKEVIYGFSVDDLFNYYISGNKVTCPLTRRHLRYYELFNIVKKKYPEIINLQLDVKDEIMVVNNFLLSIENIINKQTEFDNIVAILTEELEESIAILFKTLILGLWDSKKQMALNRDFLKTLTTGYRFMKFNSYTNKNIALILKNDIFSKIDIYYRNYSSLYYEEDIDDRISDLILVIFRNAIKKAFFYCNSFINNLSTDTLDSFIIKFTDDIVNYN